MYRVDGLAIVRGRRNGPGWVLVCQRNSTGGRRARRAAGGGALKRLMAADPNIRKILLLGWAWLACGLVSSAEMLGAAETCRGEGLKKVRGKTGVPGQRLSRVLIRLLVQYRPGR